MSAVSIENNGDEIGSMKEKSKIIVMNIVDVFKEKCYPLFCRDSIQSQIINENENLYLVLGPFRPLSGYALSNFINREYFNLKSGSVDLFDAQNLQRTHTRKNSFVENSDGEFVFISIESENTGDLEKFFGDRSDDVNFVISHPNIDSLLRFNSFQKAKEEFSINSVK